MIYFCKFVSVLFITFLTFNSTATPNNFGRFSQLQQLLDSKSSEDKQKKYTVATALQHMKENKSFSMLFDQYTIVDESFSLQTGSFRVLMFDNTAELVVTFNAKNSDEGGFALETVEAASNPRRLKFREIIFKDELIDSKIKSEFKKAQGLITKMDAKVLESELELSADEIEFENSKIAITKPNPNKCMKCHALFINQPDQPDEKIARYIWDNYNNWPRLLGGLDDRIYDDSQDSRISFVKLKKFKQQATSNDRYVKLNGLDDDYYPYLSGAKYPIGVGGPMNRRPNFLLTLLFSLNQAQVIADLAVTSNRITEAEKKQFQVTADSVGTIESNKEKLKKKMKSYLSRIGLGDEGSQQKIEPMMSVDRSTLTRFSDFYKPIVEFAFGHDILLFGKRNVYTGLLSLITQEFILKVNEGNSEFQKHYEELIKENQPEIIQYDTLKAETLNVLQEHYFVGY